jgi:peptidylprolyl isomerase
VHLSRLRILSAAVIPLLSLVACGSGKTDAKPSALDVITVGGTDKAPTLIFKTKPFTVTATTTKVLTAGTGATVSKANFVTFNYVVFNGEDGKEIESSFAKEPVGADLSDPTLIPGLSDALTGQQVGSRLLVAFPPENTAGPSGATGAGPTYSIVFLIDLISASAPPVKTTAPPVKTGSP